VAQIRHLAPYYEKIILAGYPPFVKDIIELGLQQGIEWSKYDVRIITGGEAFSEPWRDRVLQIVGQKTIESGAVNVYGMAEAGIVAHETPASVLVRRAISGLGKTQAHERFGGTKLAGMYQFIPRYRLFEQTAEGVLLLSMPTGIPLVRYNTRDRGGVIEFDEARAIAASGLKDLSAAQAAALQHWQLPLVYLFGRVDLSATLYAVNIYPENVKSALEAPHLISHVSGMFVMETKNTANMDQYLEIKIELARGVNANDHLQEVILNQVVEDLKRLNNEYGQLHKAAGSKAIPKIHLVAHGELGVVPGRKHRWVKRG